MNVNTRFLQEVASYGIDVFDVRNQMPRSGNYPWKGNTWEYCTVHYTGVWRERDTYQRELNSWIGHARHHVNTQGWPGIAYNIGISPSGRVWLMKDIERWGYHAFNTNAISMAVSCDTTLGQRPTPQMRTSLQVVLQTLVKILPRLRRQNFYSHNQMRWHDGRNAGTSCAGNFLDADTATFRSGRDFVDVREPIPGIPIQPTHAKIETPGVGEFWIVGNIFQFWSSIGGAVPVFGYPISGMTGNEKDGYVQYFERAVFHHKPDSPYPDQHDVHLQRIGVEVAEARYGKQHPDFLPVQRVEDTPTRKYFSATRHTVSNGFKGYWENYGGLRLFGYPISEEFVEDGKVVQYFERARFEWAPGTDSKRYDVQLGRLGAEVRELRQKE